jgi:hypothetical protein
MLSFSPAFFATGFPTALATALPMASVAYDYGSSLSQATPLTLAANGSASLTGHIDQPGDVDWFSFVPPKSGRVAIRESAAPGSSLDSYLSAYNARQSLLARNDDSNGTVDSLVSFNVTAGTTYFVAAAAYGTSTGAYTLDLVPAVDDFGSTAASAKSLTLAKNGSGRQAGKIDWSGDVDWFRFVAPVTGKMTITESAASGSNLDSYLYAYDNAQKLLASNDDSGTTRNSRLQINVTAGQTYYVKATAYATGTGAYVLGISTAATKSGSAPTAAPAPAPVPTSSGGFHIDLTIAGMTAAQQTIVQQAAARWEQIIVGDLPNVTYQGRVIDDTWIQISSLPIDGVGSILGQAGPTGIRSGSRLPYAGEIQLDSADVADMQSHGALLGVIEHEMGHILGIGTVWSDLGLLSGAGTSNPIFTGARATAEYNTLFHVSARGVPVENTGGGGTRDAHWRESTFGTELMTGWYDYGQVNPISRITVASLADIGYQVNMAAADAYTPPGAVRAAGLTQTISSAGVSRDLGWPSSLSPPGKQKHAAADMVFASGGWAI